MNAIGGSARLNRGEERPVAPSMVVERLVALWRHVLRTDDVTADDDFFDLGGNSIIAVRLIPLIKENFGVEPNIDVIFDNPTPRGLAAALVSLGGVHPVEPAPRADGSR